jgi:hypothetical protein
MPILVLQSSYKSSGLDVAVVVAVNRIWVLATLDISSSSLCIGFYQIACSEPIVHVVLMLLVEYDRTVLIRPWILHHVAGYSTHRYALESSKRCLNTFRS